MSLAEAQNGSSTLNLSMGSLLTIALLALLLPTSSTTMARTDPASHRIRVIFLGEVKPISFPFPGWIEADPKFTIQRVPCDVEWFSVKDAKRYVRLYLPRTYRGLVDNYDVALFEDFTPRVLPPGTLDRFQKAIGDEGLGIVLVEYVFWSANLNEIDVWKASNFYDLFPAEPIMGTAVSQGRRFYQIVREKPIFSVPDVSKWAMNGASHGPLVPKEGSIIHAKWRGKKTPAVVSRGYGKGRALQIAHGWDNIPSETVVNYRYLPDLIFNEIYFAADVAPPEDLAIVHSIRTDLIQLRARKEGAIALLEFVDKFGANTAKMEERLAQMDKMVQDVEEEYIVSDYDAAQEDVLEVKDYMADFEKSALRLRQHALLWIYIIEWIAVTATIMVCLQAVWTLMVRRRLYRAVGITRQGAA